MKCQRRILNVIIAWHTHVMLGESTIAWIFDFRRSPNIILNFDGKRVHILGLTRIIDVDVIEN